MIALKSWNHFIECCKDYDYIIISGPQRSGTTYVAKELAIELKYRHVDEFEHGISRFNRMLEYVKEESKVIQAPGLSHKLHQIINKNTLVVFMMRNNLDISRSEDRINWHKNYSKVEFNSYRLQFPEKVDRIDSFERCAPMKKWVWRRHQRHRMKVPFLQLPFDFIKESKGYVKKKDRINFSPKQTR